MLRFVVVHCSISLEEGGGGRVEERGRPETVCANSEGRRLCVPVCSNYKPFVVLCPVPVERAVGVIVAKIVWHCLPACRSSVPCRVCVCVCVCEGERGGGWGVGGGGYCTRTDTTVNKEVYK